MQRLVHVGLAALLLIATVMPLCVSAQWTDSSMVLTLEVGGDNAILFNSESEELPGIPAGLQPDSSLPRGGFALRIEAIGLLPINDLFDVSLGAGTEWMRSRLAEDFNRNIQTPVGSVAANVDRLYDVSTVSVGLRASLALKLGALRIVAGARVGLPFVTQIEVSESINSPSDAQYIDGSQTRKIEEVELTDVLSLHNYYLGGIRYRFDLNQAKSLALTPYLELQLPFDAASRTLSNAHLGASLSWQFSGGREVRRDTVWIRDTSTTIIAGLQNEILLLVERRGETQSLAESGREISRHTIKERYQRQVPAQAPTTIAALSARLVDSSGQEATSLIAPKTLRSEFELPLVRFYPEVFSEGAVTGWQIIIKAGEQGRVIDTLRGSGAPPPVIEWKLKGVQRPSVDSPAEIACRIEVRDRAANVTTSEWSRIYIQGAVE